MFVYQAVIDEFTCETCKRLHGTELKDTSEIIRALLTENRCENTDGVTVGNCRCYAKAKTEKEERMSEQEKPPEEKLDELNPEGEAEDLKNLGVTEKTDEQKQIETAVTANEDAAVNEDEIGEVTGDGSGEALPEMHGENLAIVDEAAPGASGISEDLAKEVAPEKEALYYKKLEDADKKIEEANQATAQASVMIDEGILDEASKMLAESQKALTKADTLIKESEALEAGEEPLEVSLPDPDAKTAMLVCPNCGTRKIIDVATWTGATRCQKCSFYLTEENLLPQ